MLAEEAPSSPGGPLDIGALGLPTDGPALIRYLTNSYKGVGSKTAERLVEEFGAGLFEVLHNEPDRLRSVVRASRVDQLLEGWKADLGRRSQRAEGEAQDEGPEKRGSQSRRRAGRGTRGRGRTGGTKAEENLS
jgi:hypothetical protein